MTIAPPVQTTAWSYTARDAGGKLLKGKVDASSEGAVIARLRAMGLSPVKVRETSAVGLNAEIKFGFTKHVKLKDLAIMSRQMSTMVGAGLSLLQTLNILAEQTENKELATTLRTVCKDVEGGVGFSDSLRKHPLVFPPLMANLVRAGETGGFLDKALDSVATNYEKEVKLRATIVSAMTYPVVVLIMSVLAVIAMLIFIVPVFEKMFKDLDGDLPLPTQFLVALSKVMVWLGPALIVGSIVFAAWWRKNKNSERIRSLIDPIKLKLPVFGPLMTKIAVARFTRNFGTMVGSGVPIMTALSIIGETSGNWVIEQATQRVQESVRKGKSIAKPLSEEKAFPPMVTQMIAVGEDSGSLETMLHKIGDFYDAQVQATTEQLTALIEPLIIAFLGIVIGGMIVALYMPIFSIIGTVK
jgi:type IV pilus assembly protein PilC